MIFLILKANTTTTAKSTANPTTQTTPSITNRVIGESIDWNEGMSDWQPSHPYPSFKPYLNTLPKRRPNRGLGEFDEATGLFLPPQPPRKNNPVMGAEKEMNAQQIRAQAKHALVQQASNYQQQQQQQPQRFTSTLLPIEFE